jgi:hypothetical protein
MKLLANLLEPVSYISDGGELLSLHIHILQPEGMAVGIVTHDVATASKILGVHFSPACNLATHIKYMVQKGLEWAYCLQITPLPCHNAWLSFYLQLFPVVLWGLVTVCLPPKKLNTMIQQIYAKVLLSLGMHRNIKKECWPLPEMYQGLSLPNFPLIPLADKILFLLCNWGFHWLAHSDALAMAYDDFLIEVGLYSNP